MIKPVDELDPKTVQLADIMVPRTKLPPDLVLGDELGRGANNRVFRAEYQGRDCVLRVPRRRSDTQQRGSALWELRHTLCASRLGVGPKVFAAWCARHSHGKWASGLYVVSEYFPYDLERLLCESDTASKRPLLRARRDEIGQGIVHCLHTLASNGIFVYDLKPSNVVVRLGRGNEAEEEEEEDEGSEQGSEEEDEEGSEEGDEEGSEEEESSGDIVVKIIDFGRDFCEWGECANVPDSSTPNIDMVRKRVAAMCDGQEEKDGMVTHILFASMMVILAATCTRRMHEDRGHHRMGREEREALNPIVPFTSRLLESMQGRHVALVRELLRMDEVRGVLRHYHTRRDSGTGRTLKLARGVEV